MEVTGLFLNNAAEGQLHDTAVDLLHFGNLSKKSQQVGIPPNVTDETTAVWIRDLCLRPLGSRLRQAATDAELMSLKKFADNFLARMRAHFDTVDTLKCILEVCDSLLIALETAEAAGRAEQPHAPSAVRAALTALGGLDKKSAFALALEHGALAKLVRGLGGPWGGGGGSCNRDFGWIATHRTSPYGVRKFGSALKAFVHLSWGRMGAREEHRHRPHWFT